MSRTLTLRGSFVCADNARTIDNQVFIYEGTDLSKGWEVTGAFIWATSQRGTTGADGQLQCAASLATDVVGSIGFDDICDAKDNRQIGWATWGYQSRTGSGASDFIAHSGNPSGPIELVIDPEHIVKNGLWLNMYSTSESGTSPDRTYSYMIVLRPKRLTASQAILHLIKNVAQDVEN